MASSLKAMAAAAVARWRAGLAREARGWAGMIAVSLGAGMIYPPAGLIVGGVLLIASAVLA